MRSSIISTLVVGTGLVCATSWPHGAEPACSAAVVSLATGIHLNIVGQVNGELVDIEALQKIVATSPLDSSAFLVGKGKLIADILGGIKIREFNQAIAPAGNAALPGLQQYATAQMTELGLSEGLTGTPAVDAPVLATLLSDVMAGIMLNGRNLDNATEGCALGITFPDVSI